MRLLLQRAVHPEAVAAAAAATVDAATTTAAHDPHAADHHLPGRSTWLTVAVLAHVAALAFFAVRLAAARRAGGGGGGAPRPLRAPRVSAAYDFGAVALPPLCVLKYKAAQAARAAAGRGDAGAGKRAADATPRAVAAAAAAAASPVTGVTALLPGGADGRAEDTIPAVGGSATVADATPPAPAAAALAPLVAGAARLAAMLGVGGVVGTPVREKGTAVA